MGGRTRARVVSWSAGALALAVAATGAAQSPSYTFIPIDYPSATAGTTVARGINDAGQIVGFFSDGAGTHGFIRDRNGKFTDPINYPSATATSTSPRGINSAGQIVGVFTDSAGTHGFFRDNNGKFSAPIDAPGATPRFGTFALGINDVGGQIVGDYLVATGQQRGFLDTGGSFSSIAVPGVAHSTAATAINNASQIVGYYDMKDGFLKIDGNFTTINVPGSNYTFPFGINGGGNIVGFFGAILCEPKKPTRGFLYHDGSFDTIDVPKSFQTCAYGINNSGQVVGRFS